MEVDQRVCAETTIRISLRTHLELEMYGDVLGLLECNTRSAIRAVVLFVNGLLNAVAKHAIPIRTVKERLS
jgi:hypothetical protein